MKQKALSKKLRLGKTTVSNLNNLVLANARGGDALYPTAKGVHTCYDYGEGYCNTYTEEGGGGGGGVPVTEVQTACYACDTMLDCGGIYPNTEPLDGSGCPTS